MATENCTWKVEETREIAYNDAIGRPQVCFYVRGSKIETSKAQALLNRANVSNADMHIVLFFRKTYDPNDPTKQAVIRDDQDGFRKLIAAKEFTTFNAKWVNEKVEPHYRRWSTDSPDGRFKKLDYMVDNTGGAILYDEVRVAVLCTPSGEIQENVKTKVRNLMNKNLRDGIYVLPTPETPATNGSDPAADALAAAGLTVSTDPIVVDPVVTQETPPATPPAGTGTPPPPPVPRQ